MTKPDYLVQLILEYELDRAKREQMGPGLTLDERVSLQHRHFDSTRLYLCTCVHYGRESCPYHTFDMA